MRLSIRETPEQVGRYVSAQSQGDTQIAFHGLTCTIRQVGDYLAKRINEFTPSPEKPHFVLGLPTGSSPLPTYRRLVELCQAGELSFRVCSSWYSGVSDLC